MRWCGRAARAGVLAMLCVAGLDSVGAAQGVSLQIWGRPVVAVPIGDFSEREEGVEAGASGGIDAGAALGIGALRVYGEYQQVDFACGECGEAALDDEVLELH